MTTIEPSLIHSVSMREHFSEALQSAARNQDVALHDETSVYLVNLLTAYSDAAALAAVSDSNKQLKPLAFLYSEALEAPTLGQRRRALQKLGDFALFIAGIFSDSLNRKLVDIDYCIGMGEAAYNYLHDLLQTEARTNATGTLFAELGCKFPLLVDVLAEISEASGLKSNSNTLRTYEIWLRTRSERARKQLLRSGIVPLTFTSSTAH
ncbi:MAG: hypothetical protein EXR86_16345 [Gammaproteobacteria bacterium]|nr:hypothetical protein [Gammaproteobacteria bacterium]